MARKRPIPKRCNLPGCNAWAMKGHPSGRCRQHLISELGPMGGGAPPGNLSAKTHGFHARSLFSEQELLDISRMAAQGEFSLDEEIATVKVLLKRVVESGAEFGSVVLAYTQGARDLAYLLRAKRAITGGAAEGLASAFAQALDEISTEMGIEL